MKKTNLLLFILLSLSASSLSLNILILVHKFPYPAQTYVLNDIKSLIEHGHTVFIHSIIHEHNESEIKKLLPSWYFDYNLNKKILYKEDKDTNQFLKSNTFDILYAPLGETIVQALNFKKTLFPQAKVVSAFQGYDIIRILKEGSNEWLQWLYNSIDLLLPVSDEFQNMLLDSGCKASKIKIYHTPIDESIFTAKQNWDLQKDPMILSVGRLTEKKGFEYSIKAFVKILLEYPNAKYVIIGENEGTLPKLKELIDLYNLKDNVLLLGPKNQQEISEWYTKSDVFVIPSITGNKGQVEGIPNTLKEAMFSALPCVGTDHPGIRELIINNINGLLVPEKDIILLAQAIIKILKHKKLREQFAINSFNFISQNFSLKVQKSFLNDTFFDLLNKPNITITPSPKNPNYFKFFT